MKDNKIKEAVKNRYSQIAEKKELCCSNCNTLFGNVKEQAKKIGYSNEELESIPEDSVMGLGCGNPTALANLAEGETVLDLGCGAGIDVFLAANKVGDKGRVIGVDMTKKMIEKASCIAREYGYKNIEFKLGEIENLPVEDNSVDVIISNCVINLSPDKLKTFIEAYRVLKPGGRLLISDLVTEGELPEEIRKSFDAWAGCVAGALEKNDYVDIIKKSKFRDVKIISQNKYSETDLNDKLKGKITSVKIRAYK